MNDPINDHLRRLIRQIESGVGSETRESYNAQIKPAWRRDIFKWARERLKIRFVHWRSYGAEAYRDHVWDGTREPIVAAAYALADGQSVAISSATGIGKTYFAALVILWWLDCWYGSQAVTLAPKEDQLKKHVWKEIGRLWPFFQKLHPKAKLKTLEIVMQPDVADAAGARGPNDVPSGWGACGYAVGVDADEQVAGRARGFHNEHLLFVLEEMNAIHDAVSAAVELTCTAPHNLRLGLANPDHSEDGIARMSREPGVTAIRASALDHPNVVLADASKIPGGPSREVLERWREKWGDDSPLYQSRARGIAPGQSQHALIRREWLERCSQHPPERLAELSKGEGAMGLDLGASESGDEGAWCWGRGAVVTDLGSEPCPDPNVFARLHAWPLIESDVVPARRVGVDNVGVGVGAYAELKRLGANVTPLNGGEAFWEHCAENNEQFHNLRCQIWWQARVDLSRGAVAVPIDEELWNDLTTPTWWTRGGKIWVEAKEDYKKRLRRSPNRGDAFCYWNWIRQFEAGADFSFAHKPVPF